MQIVRCSFRHPLSRLSGQNRFDDHENQAEGGLQGWLGHVDIYRRSEETTECVYAPSHQIIGSSHSSLVQSNGLRGYHIHGLILRPLRLVLPFYGMTLGVECPIYQELQADIIRQQRVQHNARVIEARIAEERIQAQLAAMPQPKPQLPQLEERGVPTIQPERPQLSPIAEPTAQAKAAEEIFHPVPDAPPQQPRPQPSYATPRRSGMPKTSKDQDWQPESWQPAPARKRT